MAITLPPGEPAAGPWRRVTAIELLDVVNAAAGTPAGRPRIIAIDGRGASGKSTLSDALCATTSRATVVHTDDLAWHDWMSHELAFFAAQQPWRRACVVVNGTPDSFLPGDTLEVAPPPRRGLHDER